MRGFALSQRARAHVFRDRPRNPERYIRSAYPFGALKASAQWINDYDAKHGA